jgi:hypothetical protein
LLETHAYLAGQFLLGHAQKPAAAAQAFAHMKVSFVSHRSLSDWRGTGISPKKGISRDFYANAVPDAGNCLFSGHGGGEGGGAADKFLVVCASQHKLDLHFGATPLAFPPFDFGRA